MWNLFTRFFKYRHLVWLTILCVALVGCKDDFDDSELRKQIADLNGRLTSLEKLCAQMNTNISSMQTIVNALQQNDYITGVTPITEGGNTTGYSITFAKNKPITIYHGKNGSSLSAKKDADGIYYWELNGSWLLDDENNRMKVSGVTPQLKIENEHWLVSVDGGKTWDDAGTATRDPLFKEVDNSAEDFVKFVFADGTEVQVPKKDTFAISFSEPLPLKISAGETVVITYTLSQGGEKTLVKTVCSNGWQAVVNKKDNLSGTITITAPDPITDDEVLVFVSDGKEKTVMSAISFCIVILDNIQDNTVKVGGGDGNLNLEITSNLEIKAVPQNEWIIADEQPQSKALATNHFHFKILANKGEQSRTGHIEVQDMGGKVLKTITVIQGNAQEEEIAKEREALIAFYHATNGDQWKNNTNWCSDKPIGEWYGIRCQNGLVEVLNLTENGLLGMIPLEIGNLGNLRILSLSINQLSGEIPSSIGQLKELTTLYLANNQLSGNIPVELGDLTNLTMADLYNNQLSGNIPSSIGNLKELDRLSLHNNQLTGIIPTEIGNLCNLTSLSLDYNQLSGEIPANIVDLKNLQELRLDNNKLEGLIPNTICQMSNLKFLWFANNHFSGNIPQNIGNLHALERLDLSHNQLTGSIPVSIKQCSNLQYIMLNSNQLQGDMMLDYFSNNKNIRALHLDHNNLTGTIPAEFTTWVYDHRPVFNITYNCLSGSLPLELISNPDWPRAEACIIPQNEGYNLEVPILYESTDYSEDGKVVVLQKATEGNGINVAIVGDGFADVDFTSGHFDKVMHKTMEGLFRQEPMKSFRHLFNVYAVKAVSKHNVFLDGCETALEGKYGSNNSGYSYAECKEGTLRNKYINKIPAFNPDEDICFVILNAYTPNASASYCRYPQGFSYSISGLGSYTPASNNLHGFENKICRGFGCTFGHLGSEEWNSFGGAATDATKEVILNYQANGWYMNLSVDPENVPWKKFLTDERYANEDVGIYEGGYYCAFGIYRSSNTSIMRMTNIDEVTFNVPSREAIYKRMMQQAYGDSWQYDYEKFVEYDAINRNSTPQLLRSTADAPKEDRLQYYPMVIIHEQ